MEAAKDCGSGSSGLFQESLLTIRFQLTPLTLVTAAAATLHLSAVRQAAAHTCARNTATSCGRDVGGSREGEMFGVQETNVTKDSFTHDVAAASLGKSDCGAARGNKRHWRVIFGEASAVVIVWPRW